MERSVFRVPVLVIASASVAFAYRASDAHAQCYSGVASDYAYSSTFTNPSANNCTYPAYVQTTNADAGPGVDFLAQDHSTSVVDGTYAGEFTSLHNDAVFGWAVASTGRGVIGVSGQSTLSIPSEYAGVLGVGAGVAGV